MLFFRTTNLQQLASFSQLHFLFIIQQLALLILEFLDLKIPGGLRIIFSSIIMTRKFASKLLSQGSIELDNLSKNAKIFCVGVI